MSGAGRAYLLDAPAWVFRALFGMPAAWQAPCGTPTQAVAGFAGFLLDFLQRERPRHVYAAFDESLGTGFRHAIDPGYKARRPLPDDALRFQFEACRALVRALGIAEDASARFEADDLLAGAAAHARAAGLDCVVLSRDKDLGQLLLGPGDRLWDYPRGEPEDRDAWQRRHGVRPEQFALRLALTGDAIDDIPGVPGVGPRTAAALLAEFPDIDALLEALPALACRSARWARIAAAIDAHRAQLARALQLATLAPQALESPPAFERRPPDAAALAALAARCGLGGRLGERLARAPETLA